MLVLTDNAATAIRELVDRADVPDSGGIRIVNKRAGAPELKLSAEPTPGDEIVERAGARVFLETGAAAMLDDRVLDAQVDLDGHVKFLVAPQ